MLRRIVKRTKKGHIHRGEDVVLPSLPVKVINAIYYNGKLSGYRVSYGGWWFTIPAEVVEGVVT